MRNLILASSIAVLLGSFPGAHAQGGPHTAPSAAAGVFAVVNGVEIRTDEYDVAWANARRQKFYHGNVPEAEVMRLRREVGDQLIDRVLLAAEANRRGIEPDQAKIREQVAGFEQRYGASPQWKTIQEQRLPALVKELERQSTVERLQAEVRKVDPPAEATVRGYYEQHPERFTEPEQIRFSVILLKVDPSSPKAMWEKAMEEGVAIRERHARGAEFAELARMHSADSSAASGGDMGYVHRGMLPDGLADELTQAKPGAIVGPVRILEGVVLARLEDRKPPQLRGFEQVRERASQLWMREESERRWKDFLAQLRKGAAIQVVEASRYPPAASETR